MGSVGLLRGMDDEAVGHWDVFYTGCGGQTNGPPKVPRLNPQNL